MATRRFSRTDGKEFARPRGSTWAANGRSSVRDARGDPSLFSPGRPGPMAATGPDRRQPPGHRFRHLSVVNRRHPRVLARIRPSQLGLWSFAVAIAHGAGLMLVPIYLGLCRAADLNRGHEAAGALINANLGMTVPGLRRPLRHDDRSRRLLGVAGLSLPGSRVYRPLYEEAYAYRNVGLFDLRPLHMFLNRPSGREKKCRGSREPSTQN